MRDVDIATRLRAAGLKVVEVAGWQTRGTDTLDPKGGVCHHTAGSSVGTVPSLPIILAGKAGVPGPLANVVQSREPAGMDDVFYVVAAGKANHAGEGGWHGITGNSHVFGLEIEHDGRSELPERRQRLAARMFAALFRPYSIGADMLCQHKEWAPTRKIDAATNVNPDQVRSWCAQALTGVPTPVPEEEEMWLIQRTLRQGADESIGLPTERKSAVVTLFADQGSVDVWGAQVEKGKANGLFGNGADWTASIPDKQGFDVALPDNQLQIRVKHQDGSGVLTVVVHGT